MVLGFLVNSGDQGENIVGLARAALDKGHSVRLFAMDEGARLLEKPEFSELADREGVKISYCEYSARQLGIRIENLNRKMKRGTQLNNAIMCQNSDKVLVL
ncbi:MAG: DsrE family protein [Proteobacteria bacterium]|nr:DsrE family protein [Pseudomonadota bacterium]